MRDSSWHTTRCCAAPYSARPLVVRPVPSYLLAYEAARTVIGTVIMFNDTNSELAIHCLLLTGVRATSSPFDGTIVSSSHGTFEYFLKIQYMKPPVVSVPIAIGLKTRLSNNKQRYTANPLTRLRQICMESAGHF